MIKVAICPICNSFKTLKQNCSTCSSPLKDSGKVSDFLDPYGHYNDVETVKMGDGYLHTAKDSLCPHLMYCNHCDHNVVFFVQEE